MRIEPDEDVAIRRVTEHLQRSCSDRCTPDEVEAAVCAALASFSTTRIRRTCLSWWNAGHAAS